MNQRAASTCHVGVESSVREFDDALLKKVRDETPGCANTQQSSTVHFNSAGSSLMPEQVVDTVTEWYSAEAATGGYELNSERADIINGVNASIARLINAADPSEIACAENATRAWDMAFYSMEFQPTDRILTSMAEYCSNYIAFLHVCEKTGAIVEPIPDAADGGVCVSSLRKILSLNAAADPTARGNVKLIAVTHVPTNGGLVNPIEEIGALATEFNIPYLVDACQSVGQLVVDVQKVQCDALSA